MLYTLITSVFERWQQSEIIIIAFYGSVNADTLNLRVINNSRIRTQERISFSASLIDRFEN